MLAIALLVAVQIVEEPELPHLKYSARHQSPDGSWGPRPARCACPDPPPAPRLPPDPSALLAALGNDDPAQREACERALRAFGEAAVPVLTEGLEHSDAEVRGRCRGLLRAAGNAVAALALSQAYGLTDSVLFQDSAQRGVSAVAPSADMEPRALAWATLVVVSTRGTRLLVDPSWREEAIARALQGRLSTLAVSVREYLAYVPGRKDAPVMAPLHGAVPAELDPETRMFAAVAVFARDGPHGPAWKAWRRGLKESILPRMNWEAGRCERGSWEGEDFRGRLRATALSLLSLQIHYEYVSVFAKHGRIGCSFPRSLPMKQMAGEERGKHEASAGLHRVPDDPSRA